MSEWWKSFFSGVALDLWRMAVPEARTRADAERIAKLLEPAPGARILDAPSGNGRIALELARRGYDLTGIDIAEDFVSEAKQAAQREQLSAEFHVGDLRNMPWSGEFDGVYCTGNSFGYFDDEGNAAFLKSVSGSLKPGGRFLLESPMVAESILHRVTKNDWYLVGDIYFLSDHRYDAVTGRLDTDYIFIRDGVVEKRPCTYRVYTCRQIREMVTSAGLRVEATWATPERDAYTLGSQEMLLLATKSIAWTA